MVARECRFPAVVFFARRTSLTELDPFRHPGIDAEANLVYPLERSAVEAEKPGGAQSPIARV